MIALYKIVFCVCINFSFQRLKSIFHFSNDDRELIGLNLFLG